MSSFIPASTAAALARLESPPAFSPRRGSAASPPASPLRAGYGGGGSTSGREGGVASGKTSLQLIEEVEVVCAGVIVRSDGMRFCSKLAKDCQIGCHVTKKVPLRKGTFHMCCPGKVGQCFTEPALPLEKVPPRQNEPDNPLELRQYEVPVWRSFILDCINQPSLADSLEQANSFVREDGSTSPLSQWTEVEVASPEQHQKLIASMKTPGLKLRLPQLEPSNPDVAPLPSVDEVKTKFTKSEEGRNLSTEVDHLADLIVTIVGSVQEEAQKTQRHRERVNQSIRALDDKLLHAGRTTGVVTGMIGSQPLSNDDIIPSGATVWEAVTGVRKALEEVTQADTEGIRNEMRRNLSSAEESLLERIRALESSIEASFQETSGFLEVLTANLGSQRNRIDRLEPSGSTTGPRGMQAHQDSGSTNARLEAIDERVADLEDSGCTGAAGEELREVVYGLRQSVTDLSRQSLGQKTLVFEEREIQSVDDVVDIMNTTGDATELGVYVDLHSLMVIMVRAQLNGKEYSDRHYASKRVERSALDSDILASLTHDSPPYLFSEKKNGTTLVEPPKGFGANVIDFNAYDVGSACARKTMEKMIARAVKVLRKRLTSRAASDRLAIVLLENAERQSAHLMQFMTNFHQDLVHTCHFESKAAWGLVGRCVRAVFIHLYEIRAELAEIESYDTIAEKAEFAFTMINSTMSMWDIIDKDFRSHPVVMNEVQLFSLENRIDVSQLLKVEQMAKEARDAVKASTAQLARLEKALVQVKQEVGNLRTELGKRK